MAPKLRANSSLSANRVNGDHSGRTQHESARNSELAYRPAPPNRYGVTWLNLSILSGHVTRWEDIREKQDFFIRQIAINPQWTYVCKRNAGILRLSTSVATHHVRIAEKAGS